VPQAEPDRQHDIGAVDDRLQNEAHDALPAAEHEAEHRVVGETDRRRENPDADIGPCRIDDFRTR
jgi:hypothetical protein